MGCVETHFWVTGVVGCLFLDSTGNGAWPFLVGELICLLHSFNDRDLSLLNSVQHDSSLLTSEKEIVCDVFLCFAKVDSTKLIPCGPICFDCFNNFALDSKCVDFQPKCVVFFCDEGCRDYPDP